MRRLTILALLFTFSILGQDPKAPREKHIEEGYVLRAVLIKDERCITDLVRAVRSSEVELRKKIDELSNYGCVEEVAGPYHAQITDSRTFSRGSARSLTFYHAHMIFDLDMHKLLTGREPRFRPEDAVKEGWISSNEFHPLREDEMVKLIEEYKRKKSATAE